MAYLKIDVMAELGKLSQEKTTSIPAWHVAALAIDRIRAAERAVQKGSEVAELKRLYRLD